MEITQAMQEAMILSLLRHDKTPSGVECSFFQFGTVGVKFYGYGEDAERSARQAFEMQRKCYEKGFAPKPGEFFRIPLKGAGVNSCPLYLCGYTTEIAILVDRRTYGWEDQENLAAALDAAGLPFGDLHGANVGYVVDEKTDSFKLVPIDFGWHFARID